MAQQDIRYYLNGMLLVIDRNQLQAVATDGHRLSWASLAIGGDYPRREVILPRKTVLELGKLLADVDDPVTLDILGNQVRFGFANVELVSKVVDGKFPDYNRVIPTGHAKKIELPRDELLAALQRAAILSNEKFRGVRLVLGPDQLKIICSNSEQEEAEEELEVAYKRRRARHRLQHHLSPRRAAEHGDGTRRTRVRRCQFERARHRARARRLQVRRDADANLMRPNDLHEHRAAPTPESAPVF